MKVPRSPIGIGFTILSNYCLVGTVIGHGSMIMPPPRNAIDSTLPLWHNQKEPPPTGLIEPYHCTCRNGTEPFCNSGQACFWFSQGCTIGCSECDGLGARIPRWDHCPHESIQPTVNDPKYRSMNQKAVAGSPEDIFYFNPWRAPGKAPVSDACGMAGGSDIERFNAGAYKTTVYAQQGDLGSKVLPPRPTGTVWTAGSVHKTRWQQAALHGGGYQYRLCPAKALLTEACFQQNPLSFVKPARHNILFGDSTVKINGTIVPDSVTGTGEWMRNPIPDYDSDYNSCNEVLPPGQHCDYDCPGGGAPTYAADKSCPCKCAEAYPQYFPSGEANVGADKELFPDPLTGHGDYFGFRNYAIEDDVVVPANIEPGEYVLGWRWDCEQTSQVWSTCADITIVAAAAVGEEKDEKESSFQLRKQYKLT